MIRAAARLVVIFLLVSGGVRLGYIQLEKKLLNGPCLPLLGGDLANRQEQEKVVEKSAAEAVVEETADQLGFQIILQRNIFQTVQTPSSAVEPKEELAAAVEVPTSLQLVLTGTVVGTDETSRAIVVDSGKKARLVRIGEQIQGATVKSISWNKVVLNVNGTEETLSMPDAKKGLPSRPKQTAAQDLDMAEAEAVDESSFVEEGVEEPSMQRPERPNRRINLPPGREYEDTGMEEDVPVLPEMEDGGAVHVEEPLPHPPPEEPLIEEPTAE